MDARSEAILSACHPTLAARVHNLAYALTAEGFDPHIDQGLRTVAQQDALYAQGRTIPGEIVTNALGVESNHCYGFAADFFFEKDGAADWESMGFERLQALAPSYGLRSGAAWGDRPHVEMDDFPPVPTAVMQETLLAGGTAMVWRKFPVPSVTDFTLGVDP